MQAWTWVVVIGLNWMHHGRGQTALRRVTPPGPASAVQLAAFAALRKDAAYFLSIHQGSVAGKDWDWLATYIVPLNIDAMCLSPMLPVGLVMGQAVATSRLSKNSSITGLQPARIQIARKISTIDLARLG